MTTISINTIDAKEEFSELISRVAHNKERIILVRRSKAVAAIVPMEDFSLIEEKETKLVLEEAVEALKEARTKGTMTLEALQEEIG